MKLHWFAIAALPLVAGPALFGQQNKDGADGSKSRLTRVERHDNDDAFDRDAWKKKLSDANLDERERAADELSRLARQDADARSALEQWSKDEKNRELAWTSRMLLREVGRNPWGTKHPKAFGGGNGFGNGNDFDFDDFAKRFDDLDSMFGNLRDQWGDMLKTLPPPSAGGTTSSRSMSLTVGPDGVTCEVTEKVDGKDEKHTYTAKTMDELLEAHPELRDSLGNTHFQFGSGTLGQMQMFPRGSFDVFPRGGAPRARAFAAPHDLSKKGELPTDRLGLMCKALERERADELGVEHGVGLAVAEVQPDTIASQLGIREGDVVVELNGTTIHGTDDVKKVLAERAADADVSVVVVGENGHKRTLTWKPNAAAKPEGKSGSRNL
jgi:hypothetical protein